MKKRLNIKNINSSSCLTARELSAFLTRTLGGTPELNVLNGTTPIILKCAGKNFQLSELTVVNGKPVLIGKRRPTIG